MESPEHLENPYAATGAQPCVAVIFSSRLSADAAGYEAMAAEMARLAALQPGFLGMESARDADGFGISVSYWKDEASARAWKAHPQHLKAQEEGRRRWYRDYRLRIARLMRAYGHDSPSDDSPSDDSTSDGVRALADVQADAGPAPKSGAMKERS